MSTERTVEPVRSTPFRLGACLVDPQRNRITCNGSSVQVQPKVMDVLLALCARSGEVIGKDELFRTVWPDMFVTDHVLTHAVWQLRKALGNSKLIESVSKRGYRVTEEVFFNTSVASVIPSGPPDQQNNLSEVGAIKPRSVRLWAYAVGAAAILLIAGIVLWLSRQAVPPIELKAVTEISGDARMPSLSPDGKRVAFAWNGGKGVIRNIYVQQIGSTGPPLRLTQSAVNERFPAWSPDDRWIAFMRDPQKPGDTSRIVLIPPLGGPERTLTEVIRPVTQSEPGTNLSWTPDGKWLAFSAAESPFGAYNIWAVSLETGERRRLTSFPPQLETADIILGDRSPSFSPDGSTLAFGRSAENRVFYLHVQTLTPDLRPTGATRKVTDQQFGYVSGIAWMPDGRNLVFAAGDAAANFLWRVPVSGEIRPERLSFSQPDSEHPSIAGSPPRLVYTWGIAGSALMALDTRTRQIRPLSERASVSSHPDYSPDGRKIAFQSTSSRTGNSEIWTCDEDGGNCSQLTSFNGPRAGTPDWSPDGRWIALSGRVNGQLAIYVIAADGGKLRRVTSFQGNNLFPSWSHDGEWIYFGSNRNGRNDIWKIPVDGGAEVQVTRSGGYASSESPDGKYLYYSKDDHYSGLFRMPTAGGAEVQVLPRIGNVNSFAIAADGIYFLPDETTIQFLDFKSGRVSTLATLDRPTGLLTVKPGDHFVAWIQQSPRQSNLVMVENFR